MAARAWPAAAAILAVRLDAMGDVLMTSPALRALKGAGPGRRLTLLTSPAGAAAARLIPEVDEVIAYAAPWVKATPPRRTARPDWRQIARLRARRFDAAVIFTVFSQNPLPAALMCMLADIPLRLAHCRENPYQLLTDWVADPEPAAGIRHEVRRQLDLVGAVGCRTIDERISVRVTDGASAAARRHLRALGLAPGSGWVAIHPGASAPSRRYPPELFARVAARLARDEGLPVVFTGEAREAGLVEQIREAIGAPSHSLAGRLTLEELAALISLAPVLVCNNTGPAHLAAGVGTPVVDLYALTNPQHTPWQVPSRVLFHDVACRHCFKSICPEGHNDCLRRVEPERVLGAVRELLAATAAPRTGDPTYVHAGH